MKYLQRNVQLGTTRMYRKQSNGSILDTQKGRQMRASSVTVQEIEGDGRHRYDMQTEWAGDRKRIFIH